MLAHTSLYVFPCLPQFLAGLACYSVVAIACAHSPVAGLSQFLARLACSGVVAIACGHPPFAASRSCWRFGLRLWMSECCGGQSQLLAGSNFAYIGATLLQFGTTWVETVISSGVPPTLHSIGRKTTCLGGPVAIPCGVSLM